MAGGGMGDMRSLLEQAQNMQKGIQQVERDLAERVLEGTAGGGVVKVYINGAQEVQGVKIAKEVVDPEDIETLEDLVTGALRQAVTAAKELRETEMKKVTDGMNLPGMGF